MSIDDKIKLFQEYYKNELERKNKLNDSINFVVGILSAFSALIFYFFSDYSFGLTTWLDMCFVIALLGSMIFTGIAIFYLIKSSTNWFKGYEYDDLPYPNILNEHFDKLGEYYSIKNNYDENKSDEEIKEYLLGLYLEASNTMVRHDLSRPFAEVTDLLPQ